MTSPFRKFCDKWKNGCGAEICQLATKVVIGRGRVPCDIVFIGEAPGDSEDSIGQPFIGPAGHLLDTVIDRSIGSVNQIREQEGQAPLTYALTNLVGCIPLDETTGEKSGEPDDESVKKCAPRLKEFVRLCDGWSTEPGAEPPKKDQVKLIVCVGSLARDWLDEGYRHSIKFHRSIPRIDITHPAAVLRMNVAQKGLATQRCIVQILTVVREL